MFGEKIQFQELRRGGKGKNKGCPEHNGDCSAGDVGVGIS